MEHSGALRRIGAGLAREATSVARCAVRYPLGIAGAALTTGRPAGDSRHGTPVILVHGYGHNRSGWWVLQRRLKEAGFTSIHTVNYLPLGGGIPSLAQRLADRVEEVQVATGAARVHMVGHSLGGILMRWYVQELGGQGTVDTAITLGSPHQGIAVAAIGPERTAQDLRPGSMVMARLAAGPAAPAGAHGPAGPTTDGDEPPSAGVRWITYRAEEDLLVPPAAASLAGAVNIGVGGVGHLGLLLSPAVAESVTHQLQAAEGVIGRISPISTAGRRADAGAGAIWIKPDAVGRDAAGR